MCCADPFSQVLGKKDKKKKVMKLIPSQYYLPRICCVRMLDLAGCPAEGRGAKEGWLQGDRGEAAAKHWPRGRPAESRQGTTH